MSKHQAKFISVNALAMALVCISTMIVQIPIPMGYMHLGNVCILLAGAFFGPVTGALAGGLGSAMADLLTGYAVWVLPTLMIKSVMGFAVGYLAWGGFRSIQVRMMSVKTMVSSAAGVVIMVMGYFAAGSVLSHSIEAGAAQIPGLLMEGILGAVLFFAVGLAFEKAHIGRLLSDG